MAITNGVTSVGTVAIALHPSKNMPGTLHIANQDNTDTVYLGGPGVTTATGHPLEKLTSEQYPVYPEQVMYAVSGKAGHNVSWILITP